MEKVEKLVRDFRDRVQAFYDGVKEYSDTIGELSDEEKEEYRKIVGSVPMGILMVVKAHPEEGKRSTFAINLSFPSPDSQDDPILMGAIDMFTGVMSGMEPLNAKSMALQLMTAVVRASGMSALETSNQMASQVLEEGYTVSRLIQAKFQERMKEMVANGKVKVDVVPQAKPDAEAEPDKGNAE